MKWPTLVLSMQTIMELGVNIWPAPPCSALSVDRAPRAVSRQGKGRRKFCTGSRSSAWRVLSCCSAASRSRSEIVATFIAVLELCRDKVIHLAGSDTDCYRGVWGRRPRPYQFV